jgi:hypothetical protein
MTTHKSREATHQLLQDNKYSARSALNTGELSWEQYLPNDWCSTTQTADRSSCCNPVALGRTRHTPTVLHTPMIQNGASTSMQWQWAAGQ